MGQDPAAIRQEIEQTRERMGQTVDALGYKADVPARAKESIAGRVQGVKEKIVGTGQQVQGRAQAAGAQLSDTAHGVGDQLADATPDSRDLRQAGQTAVGIAQSNPLGLAIGAAAVGFLAGMLIPSTPIENERLGPVSDQLKRQARETGHDALEHGRQVVAETAQVAQEQVHDLAEDITEVARATADTAVQRAQEAAEEVRDTAQGAAQEHAEDLSQSARQGAEAVAHSAPTQTP